MKTIARISELQIGAKNALEKFCSDEEYEFPDDIDDLVQIVSDCGDHEDEKDSCDILHTYTLEINGWRFIASGSQYIKDQGICDEQMDDTVAVEIINTKKTEDEKQWEKFFSGKTKKELFDKLKTTKFNLK